VNRRKLPCELCGREVAIRSRVRTGVFEGKKCCPPCKQKCDKKPNESKVQFFTAAIERVKSAPFCENCGCKIDVGYMVHSNVAHILGKSKYKSVANEPLNFVILCSGKNDEEHLNCHHIFDNSVKSRPDMFVFDIAKERFKQFLPKIKESGIEREIFEKLCI